MADEIHHGSEYYQKDRKFKDLGDGSYAEYVALEPGSITPPGGASANVVITDPSVPAQQATVSSGGRLQVELPPGGGGAVTIVDGGDVAQGTTTDLDTANTVVGLLKKIKSLLNPVDVSDRVGRLLGHVTVDNASIAVTGTFWQATQPVSGPLTDTQLRATPVPVSGTVTASGPLTDTQLRASAVPVSGTFWQGTQPVSAVALTDRSQKTQLTDGTRDGTIKAASTLPVATDTAVVVTARDSIPVTGTFWQTTQPVSLATNTPDVTDRAARLLGHVTVDNASLAVTGTFWQATQPVSGTVTANQGTANATPWNENIAQVGGVAIATKAGGTFGQTGIPVWPNARQLDTYTVNAVAISTGALTAATRKDVLSLEHAGTSTKTVKIRRIIISATITTAGAAVGTVDFRLFTGTAASSAGTAITPAAHNKASGAAEVVAKSLPTMTAAGGPTLNTSVWAPAAAGPLLQQLVLYDWQENGETVPITLRSGTLETVELAIQAVSTPTILLYIMVLLTEE